MRYWSACLPSPRLTVLLQTSQGPGQPALISRIPCPPQCSSCSSMITLMRLYSHPLMSPSVPYYCSQGGSLSCSLRIKLGLGKDNWKYQASLKTSRTTHLLNCIIIILFKSKKCCYPACRLTMVQKCGSGFHQDYCRSGSMQHEGN